MSAPPPQSPDRDGQLKRRRRRSSSEMARTGGLLVVAILATLFAVTNLEEVKVHWIIGSGHAPLIIVIVVAILGGIVLTYLAERLARKRR